MFSYSDMSYAIYMQIRIYLHIKFNIQDLNIIPTNVFPNRTAWRIKPITAEKHIAPIRRLRHCVITSHNKWHLCGVMLSGIPIASTWRHSTPIIKCFFGLSDSDEFLVLTLSDLRNIYIYELECPAQVEFCAIRNWVYINVQGSPTDIHAELH